MEALKLAGRDAGRVSRLFWLWAAVVAASHSAAAPESREFDDDWTQSRLFATAIQQARARIDPLLDARPEVPVPKDPGGGYTHERHKANGILIAEAGALYRWTGESAYADFAGRLLDDYAAMYPELGAHPERKEQSPGRLFWQTLNESVWLAYVIQGYDAIRDALDGDDRHRIETQLLRPMARFLSLESPEVLDKIHNHGTWAVAAVGVTGYVLDDEMLVDLALMGTARDGKTGFFAQLRQLFSPDGYYLEGPYYQRYALMPFVLFARAIEVNEPGRRIFEYREGILVKAIRTTVDLSYAGMFFPVNDAIRDKGLDTVELDHAIAAAYGIARDPSYLSLIEDASNLALTTDGLRLALAKEAGLETPFPFASRHLRDGPAGDRGALTILRAGKGPHHSALVFKATSHGMGHGHFDRLHWMFYDNGAEIVADYGAARFLNVPQKAGGRYLPENTTWAKQTAAHNTLLVDGASQFGGDPELADLTWPSDHFYRAGEGVQIVSAREDAAYPGAAIRRTMLLIEWPGLEYPLVVDLLKARSKEARRFDLPLYFKGDLIEAQPKFAASPSLRPMGSKNGYQHLWRLGGTGVSAHDRAAVTWLRDGRFYTYSVMANADLDVMSTRVGATDPDFNLRPEPGLLFRAGGVRDLDIVAVLEPHGEYSGAREYTIRSESQIAGIERFGAGDMDLVSIRTRDEAQLVVALSYDVRPDQRHEIRTTTGTYEWRGFHRVFGDPQMDMEEEY